MNSCEGRPLMNRERKLPVRSQSISVESERGASHFLLPEGSKCLHPGRIRGFCILHSKRQGQEDRRLRAGQGSRGPLIFGFEFRVVRSFSACLRLGGSPQTLRNILTGLLKHWARPDTKAGAHGRPQLLVIREVAPKHRRNPTRSNSQPKRFYLKLSNF